MELWIRNQNKERLLQVKYLELFFDEEIEDNDEYLIYAYINEKVQYLLGIYKGKERALEVLDEIQEHINDILTYDHLETKIYQMPKE